jgi:hypothetical protein
MIKALEYSLILVFACYSLGKTANAQDNEWLPQQDSQQHMGVASCASSMCHGKNSIDTTKNVQMNEYRIWLKQDYHARSYKTLLSKQSKDMVQKLGLPNAHKAAICLDCHADNVDKAQRGFRFQITDGVGCEACHGGSEDYLKSHTEVDVTHLVNLGNGMYATEKPLARAKLCLSCHLGNSHKFASHQLMGAGHPRLSFELETFTVNQPAHYAVDDDYRQRKGNINSVNMWLAGIVVSASETMKLLENRLKTDNVMPELALFECHSCHHGMDQLQWQSQTYPTPAGTVRINDANILLLRSVLTVLDNKKAKVLDDMLNTLHRLSNDSIQSTQKNARQLHQLIEQWSDGLVNQPLTVANKRLLLMSLLRDGANHSFSDFTSAELVFLGVETLMLDLNISQRYQQPLDTFFKSVENENSYKNIQFKRECNALLSKLSKVYALSTLETSFQLRGAK